MSTDVLLFSESGSSLVHHYRVFGRRHTHPFVESLWLDFEASSNTQRAKSNGSSIGYRAGEISYRRHQIPFAAFDRGIRSMNPRSATPGGWYPRSHWNCQLTTSHQRVLRQSSRLQDQLRPMSRQRRGHVLSCAFISKCQISILSRRAKYSCIITFEEIVRNNIKSSGKLEVYAMIKRNLIKEMYIMFNLGKHLLVFDYHHIIWI